jgi:hypothetical protein
VYEREKFGALLQAFSFGAEDLAHFKEVIFKSIDLDMIHQSEWDALDLSSTISIRLSRCKRPIRFLRILVAPTVPKTKGKLDSFTWASHFKRYRCSASSMITFLQAVQGLKVLKLKTWNESWDESIEVESVLACHPELKNLTLRCGAKDSHPS